jgi:hypothetical protein
MLGAISRMERPSRHSVPASAAVVLPRSRASSSQPRLLFLRLGLSSKFVWLQYPLSLHYSMSSLADGPHLKPNLPCVPWLMWLSEPDEPDSCSPALAAHTARRSVRIEGAPEPCFRNFL